MLYKAVAIILSALFIALVQVSTASAGGCHGGGHGFGRLAFHQFQTSQNQSYALQKARERRAAEARALAAAKAQKQAAAIREAKAEKKAEQAKVAAASTKTETTPVAETASAESKTTEPVKVAEAGQTCTRFVAEIGTTVTTDCATK